MSELMEFGEEQCRGSWDASSEQEKIEWLKWLNCDLVSSEAQCKWFQLRSQTKAAILEEWLDDASDTGRERYQMEYEEAM